MATGLGGRDIRLYNKNRVLKYIYRSGGTTKQHLVEALGMSLPTVLQNIKELLAEELICELGQMESTGGRKAMVIAPVAGVRLSVGADVRKSHVQLTMIDLTGAVIHSRQMSMPYRNIPAYYAWLGETIHDFLREADEDEAKVLGVGFSIPGIIEGDMITDSHALGIRAVPTRAFCEHVRLSASFINDANAAALAEIHAEDSLDTFAYLSLNDCVGGSIVLKRRMYMGDNCRAGEFGHMRLMPMGRACYCGMEGCVDAFCAAPVLAEHASGNLDAFFSMLGQGDAECAILWNNYLDALAISVNNLRMAFDCPIVLGGEAGGYLTDFLDAIRLRAGRINTFGRDGSYLHTCKCRRHASALGAALTHVDRFFMVDRTM